MASVFGNGGMKMSVTKAQKKKYLANGGAQCLFCESHDLEVLSQVDSDDSPTKYLIHCYGCGKRWVDIHDLIDVEEA